ncbi:HupE/UreJ family protein [Sulfurimonas sp.]|uniref:HupE/UreJ family protein n=1 Tax=Sulfurimonas sp. TaxID=2022749 RepID=UPI003565692B
MRTLLVLSALFLLNTTAYAHGISAADKQAMLDGGNLKYIWLGATHMLTGYDHLLFLFGVVFFLNTIKDIVKFVSVFTLGHSITLILATFMGVNANYYLIDAVIAISVIYKAFDNNKGFQNYLHIKSPNMLWMVFLFGLIHGFGLSTRLQQLPLGEDSLEILMKIISFNIGVEFGQIIALVPILFILMLWRQKESFMQHSKVTNHAIMFAGFMLLLMQLHGYLHTTNEEEFGFNRDEHYHIHVDMKAEEAKQSLHGKL